MVMQGEEIQSVFSLEDVLVGSYLLRLANNHQA